MSWKDKIGVKLFRRLVQMYEYYAEIRVEITEDDFIDNFGREPKDEAEWNAYCDKLIDDTYDAVETIKESVQLNSDDWKVV